MADIDIETILTNNPFLLNVLTKNEEIIENNFQLLNHLCKSKKEFFDSIPEDEVDIRDNLFYLQIQYGILLSLLIEYVNEQIIYIYIDNCGIKKVLTDVTIKLPDPDGVLQRGGGIFDLKTLFFLFIFNLLLNANDLVPGPYTFGSKINIEEGNIPEARSIDILNPYTFGSKINIEEGNIPEARSTINNLNPSDNKQMLIMSNNYDFTTNSKIPEETQIIFSANLNDLYKPDFESRNPPSFMDILLNPQRQLFNEFVNQEVKKINLIYVECMKNLREACDSMIELTPPELPVAFFQEINEKLKREVDNMLDEKTEIIEELKTGLEKEFTEIAISEHGALKEEPSLYENIMGQFQFSLYSKSPDNSNELVAQETLTQEESDKIQNEIEVRVTESLNELSPKIDEQIFQKKIDEIMKDHARESEAFAYKTNRRVYLDNVCKKAFSKPVSIKFDAEKGELILKDKPQSRFHINVLIRNFQHNIDKLLASVRDEPKRSNLVSLKEKSEVMFGLITSFDYDINNILNETETSDTIEEYTNKIFSFFENLKKGANDALKSNPITERERKIADVRNMEEAQLESKKIKSESQVEETIAKAELESRIISHNISEKEWQQFNAETKLLSVGVYDTMGTFVNPFFDGLSYYFNNLLTKSYSLLILLICFGASVAAWRTGLINKIFEQMKRRLDLSIKTTETNKIERDINNTSDSSEINRLQEELKRKNIETEELKKKIEDLNNEISELLYVINNSAGHYSSSRRRGGKSKTKKNKKNKKSKKSKRNNLKKGKKSKRNNRKKNKCYTKKSI